MRINRTPFQPGDDEAWAVDNDGTEIPVGPLLQGAALQRLIKKVRRSQKFRDWDARKGTKVFERHFSPQQLANDWGVSAETIRILFRNEAGVLRIPSRLSGKKRDYVSLKIPQSVAERVHRRLSAVPSVRR